ncbi:Rieske (2Fe-2S) protein [Streptomyces sp. NPDC001941]|uniref:Rieske (2Fe-2S) protein n=1 Tax=Streptomyces sp. NPDC001941 TaxID=3154659 RepID=UPI00332D5CF8
MSTESLRTGPGAPGRRTVIAAVGAAGLAAALTACGDGAEPGQSAAEKPATGGTGGGQDKGKVLARTADIPEGGGKVVGGVVVTQPRAGEYKAFSATCTHQGCTVKDVAGGTINCPCHGSKFDPADGSVKAGPASTPLPAAPITVEGGSIKLA